jgi:hypothetical protein
MKRTQFTNGDEKVNQFLGLEAGVSSTDRNHFEMKIVKRERDVFQSKLLLEQ